MSIGITVVIPAYNRAKTIGYALKSVLEQTYAPNEVLVVDDRSTDNTIAVVEAIGDPRIRVIKQERNAGAQAARNRGITEARNEWIALHDSDDEWMPNKLELQVKELEKTGFDPLTVVHCNCIQYFEATGERRLWELPFSGDDNAYSTILREPGPMFQGMLTSKTALQKIGLLDEAVPSYQEWDTAIRLARYCRFIHIQEPLFVYYFHKGETISKGFNSTINGYHFNRLKHKQETIRVLGQKFYDENVRWNIQRAFDEHELALAAKLIKQTYSAASAQSIYLGILASLKISPRQVDKVTGLPMRTLRYLKRKF
jgi:glycosyltransferase involved in cell wall biosynthesis